jgi:hypothetical protein
MSGVAKVTQLGALAFGFSLQKSPRFYHRYHGGGCSFQRDNIEKKITKEM